jgi:mannosylglycerate hydrolase
MTIKTQLNDSMKDAMKSGDEVRKCTVRMVLAAVKETENGKGWIVRGYNISSETIQLNLKPMRRFGQAARVNLAEEEISPLKMEGDGNIEIPVAGHEIVSVMFSDLPTRQF